MTSRGVLTVAVALLLVTAGCLGAGGGSTDGDAPAAQAGETDTPTLSASGTGSVSADPDRALVRFAVVVEADTAEAARETAAQRADGVRSALEDAGVGEDDLRTTGFSLSARYDYDRYDRGERELLGYRVIHSFEATVADVDDAGAVVDATVAGGATRVDGVQFTLADETRADLRSEAVAAAVADARADADAAAGAAGVDLDGVRSLTVGSVGYVPYDGRYAEAAADGDATPTTFSPGPVTVTATVSVTYAHSG